MNRPSFLIVLAIGFLGVTLARADDPPKPTPPQVVKKEVVVEDPKPLPPMAIPDDPPPHEGAMIDLPYTIEPPDIIVVEVLEALAGRPITGEHLVRQDGTIHLGFYGEVHVRGLTIKQAKVKILAHLRKFITDEVLGLKRELPRFRDDDDEVILFKHNGMEGQLIVPPVIPTPGNEPSDLKPAEVPNSQPKVIAPTEKKPDPNVEPQPKAEVLNFAPRRRRGVSSRDDDRRARRPRLVVAPRSPLVNSAQDPKPVVPVPAVPGDLEPPQVAPRERQWETVEPADNLRAFVDIVSYNSVFYYVQGDVGVPGRLPFTGNETVLDALNYAGGSLPSAEPTDIHLYRPARGGKPAKDYKIDIDAINRGVATANLQIFPNDRLIVGRNAVVKRTVEIDRAAAPINSVLSSLILYSSASRALGASKVGGQNPPVNLPEPAAMTSAQREAFVKDWFDFFWTIGSRDSGLTLDDKALREAVLKRLEAKTEPAPKP